MRTTGTALARFKLENARTIMKREKKKDKEKKENIKCVETEFTMTLTLVNGP